MIVSWWRCVLGRSRLDRHALHLSSCCPDFMVDLSILRAVRWGFDRRFVITSAPTSAGLAQPHFLVGLLRWWTRQWCPSRSRICGPNWCTLCDQLDLLVFTSLFAFFAIDRSGFLLFRDISANDSQVPEHEIGDQDLFKQRPTSIGELNVTETIDGSFDVDGVSSVIVWEPRRCG